VWAEVIEAIGPAPASDQCWVSVSDRASDIFSLVRRARAQNWHCLWRVGQNRLIVTVGGRKAKLLNWVRRLPAQTKTVIELRGRAEQPSRTVHLQVAWNAVTLCPPRNGRQRQQEPVSGWCVRCWEPGKKNALEWVLFTTVPVTDTASALERIEWYRLRWVVEEYHKALKTGCAMEQRLIGFSGDRGGPAVAVAYDRSHGSGYTRDAGGRARVTGNGGPVPRRVGGPDDRRPVLARGGGSGRVLRPQGRR
jgi:hypothetical protein